jgi:phosphoribosylaminoimidazole carboxylase (NCAIR synthetase)
MFAVRARTMGYRVMVLDPDAGSPAGSLADEHLQAAYTDEAALSTMAARCSAITTEFENVPAEVLQRLARSCVVRPTVETVAIAQDRIAEKTFLQGSGFPTAPFAQVRSRREVDAALREVGLPALLKTSRLGYDGKGQRPVDSADEAVAAFEELGAVECVLEQRFTLETELSVVLARSGDGAVAPFPPGENRHRDGILETTVVPAGVSDRLAGEARALAIAVAERLLDVLGLLEQPLALLEQVVEALEVIGRDGLVLLLGGAADRLVEAHPEGHDLLAHGTPLSSSERGIGRSYEFFRAISDEFRKFVETRPALRPRRPGACSRHRRRPDGAA